MLELSGGPWKQRPWNKRHFQRAAFWRLRSSPNLNMVSPSRPATPIEPPSISLSSQPPISVSSKDVHPATQASEASGIDPTLPAAIDTPENPRNAGDPVPARPGIRTAITRRLYISHFLSTWNSRSFEFGAVLFLASVFPNTLLPLSIYALVRSASAIVFAPMIGRAIDRRDRLQVVRFSIGKLPFSAVESTFCDLHGICKDEC